METRTSASKHLQPEANSAIKVVIMADIPDTTADTMEVIRDIMAVITAAITAVITAVTRDTMEAIPGGAITAAIMEDIPDGEANTAAIMEDTPVGAANTVATMEDTPVGEVNTAAIMEVNTVAGESAKQEANTALPRKALKAWDRAVPDSKKECRGSRHSLIFFKYMDERFIHVRFSNDQGFGPLR
jgi:hypothetical protein